MRNLCGILGMWSLLVGLVLPVYAAELELAAAGQPKFDLLLPATPTPQEKVAAAELRKGLGQMTGADFKIVAEPGKIPFISIGRTVAFLQHCPKEAAAKLGPEGYGIAVDCGNLYLYGGTQRGPLYAVMALLEEDLGCRWYTPDCTMIPHRPDLKFTPRIRQEQPQFDNREAYFYTAVNPEWALHNRSNPRWFKLPPEWGGSMNAPANCWNVHTMYLLLPNREMSTHPEFFPMRAGKRVPLNVTSTQPCLAAPGLADYLAVRANEVLDRNPSARLISISQNDNDGWCECPTCQSELKQGYNRTDQMIRLVNAVAAKIRAKHPNVTVSTLAYMGTFMPPNKIKPDPQLRIQLCTDKHAFRWPHLTVDQTPIFYPALCAWHRLGLKLYIWDYVVNFYDYLLPRANIGVVADNLKLYRNNGVDGVMLQGTYQEPCGADAELKAWVWTQLLWNPNLDWRKLERDFIAGYFQQAAPAVQAYYDLLEQTRRQWHARPGRSDDLMFDQFFLEAAEKHFATAEHLAGSDPTILKRVLSAELPVIYLRLQQTAAADTPLPRSEYGRYEKLLRKFADITAAEHITKTREGGERGTVAGKINELKINLFGKKAVLTADTMAVCEEFSTMLWRNTKIVPDAQADNGFAVRQPPNNREWSVQWRNPTSPKLQPGRQYGLRVRMRFVLQPGTTGNVFDCGVYNQDAGEYLKKRFTTSDLKPGYAWYNIGAFVPQQKDCIYIAPCNNPGVKEMYFDRMEIHTIR